jgi:protein BUR2
MRLVISIGTSLADQSSIQEIAAVSLLLATKTEENIRRLKDIIVACCRVAQKNANLVVDEQSKDYWRWRDTLLLNEDILLEHLCFDLTVECTHTLLFELIKKLKQASNKELRNAAWAFVNDSSMTVLCLRFPPRVVAHAALYFGAKRCGLDAHFSEYNDAEGRPWFAQNGVAWKSIVDAIMIMCAYIELNHAKMSTAKDMYDGVKNTMKADYDSDFLSGKTPPSPVAEHWSNDASAIVPDDNRGIKRERNEEEKQSGEDETVSKQELANDLFGPEADSERHQKRPKTDTSVSPPADVKPPAKRKPTVPATAVAENSGSEEGEVEE